MQDCDPLVKGKVLRTYTGKKESQKEVASDCQEEGETVFTHDSKSVKKCVAGDSNEDASSGSEVESVWLAVTPAVDPLEIKSEAGVSDENHATCTSFENVWCPQAEAGSTIEVVDIKKEPEDLSPAAVLEELAEVKEDLSAEGSSSDLGDAVGGESQGTRTALFDTFDDNASSVQGTGNSATNQRTGECKLCSKCSSEPCSCFQPASSSASPQSSRVPLQKLPSSSVSTLSQPTTIISATREILSDLLRKFGDGTQLKISQPSSSSHVGTHGKGTDPNTKKSLKPPKEGVIPVSHPAGNVSNHQPSKKTESDFLISLAEYLFRQEMTSQQIKDIRLYIRRLKRKCQKSGRTSFKDICKLDSDPDVKNLAKHMSSMRFNMLKGKIRCPPRRYIWTAEEKIEYLGLYQRSPRCYMVLNMAFAMPKRKNLNVLINSLVFQPGINPNIFKCLGAALKDMPLSDALCYLAFDVMTVEQHLTYNNIQDYIEGYEDFGDERTSNVANGALVFMLCGLGKKWKMPVAYFLCHDISAPRLQKLINKVLLTCDDAGAKVIALVCDTSVYNIKALKSMGASFSNPYIPLRGRNIATIYDPPSLLKYTRNLLQRCFVKVTMSDSETCVASWEHLRVLFELDKVASVQLVPKLTKEHVCPVGKARREVKIAAETLSHSVAKAVSTLVSNGELPYAGQATSVLIEELDSLFDSLIGEDPEPKAGKTYRCMVTKDSPHTQYWSEVYGRIKQWQFVDVKTGQVLRAASCKGGWLATLRAAAHTWDVIQKYGLSHMKPRCLSLDALRNMFTAIHSVHGRDLLTSTQFINGFKLSIISDTSSEADTAYLISELQKHFLDQIGSEPSPLPAPEDRNWK